MSAIRTLLAEAIDYAGLFPPAQLSMGPAVRNYAEYRAGPDAWALGRFVVPAGRLDELTATLASEQATPAHDRWPLSILAGPALEDDLARIAEAESRAPVSAAALEIRASSPDEIARIGRLGPAAEEVYVEIPLDADLEGLVRAIAHAGLRAKMRTGGVTAEAIPAATAIADFILACTAAGVAFKATAGLHHLRRGTYRLTYEPQSASAPMHGYLNVFVAAALARAGAPRDTLVAVLEEATPGAFLLLDNGIAWREHRLTTSQLAAMRTEGLTGFGSCSFREPLDELAEAGIA